jgi:hypothetical protein
MDCLVLLVIQYKDLVVRVVKKVLVDLKVGKDLQLQRVSKVSKVQQPLQEFLVTKDPQVIRVLKETSVLVETKDPVDKKVLRVIHPKGLKDLRVTHQRDLKVM